MANSKRSSKEIRSVEEGGDSIEKIEEWTVPLQMMFDNGYKQIQELLIGKDTSIDNVLGVLEKCLKSQGIDHSDKVTMLYSMMLILNKNPRASVEQKEKAMMMGAKFHARQHFGE